MAATCVQVRYTPINPARNSSTTVMHGRKASELGVLVNHAVGVVHVGTPATEAVNRGTLDRERLRTSIA